MSCVVGEAPPHSPTPPSLHVRHSLFSNPCVVSSTSQLILQPFHRFTYFNPPVALHTSQALHLRHQTSRPCEIDYFTHPELATVF